jgi:arylsulfatase A-like enzyme
VSLVDVTPTILDLAGLGGVATGDGVSLRSLFEQQVSPPSRRVVFGEARGALTDRAETTYVARSREAKCMLGNDGEPRCYDLRSDPGERHPLSPDSSPGLDELAKAVVGYRERSVSAPAHAPAADEEEAERDAKREEQLRALGYVE